jgi:hypothetical protein
MLGDSIMRKVCQEYSGKGSQIAIITMHNKMDISTRSVWKISAFQPIICIWLSREIKHYRAILMIKFLHSQRQLNCEGHQKIFKNDKIGRSSDISKARPEQEGKAAKERANLQRNIEFYVM